MTFGLQKTYATYREVFLTEEKDNVTQVPTVIVFLSTSQEIGWEECLRNDLF